MEAKRVVLGLAGVVVLAAGLLLVLSRSREVALPGGLVKDGEPAAAIAESSSELEHVGPPAHELARSSVVVDAPAPTNATEARYERVAVTARVLDTDAQPIANAEVRIARYVVEHAKGGEPRAITDKLAPIAVATTDEHGKTELTFVPAADGPLKSVRLVASKPGFATERCQALFALDAHRADAGELVLQRAAVVAGRLVEEGGPPVEGGRLTVVVLSTSNQWETSTATALSNASGAFEIADAPPGRVRVHAGLTDERRSNAVELELAPGERRDGIELVVPVYEAADAISGVVLDPAGAPVERARVHVRGRTASGTSTSTARTDDRGRFRVQVKPGSVIDVEAMDEAGELAPATRKELGPGAHGLVMQLGHGTLFELAVVDDSGVPVEEYAWQMWVQEGNTTTTSASQKSAPRAGGIARLRADPRPFTVDVRAAGYEPARTETIDPAALPSRIEVRMARLPSIRGRVTAGGAGVAGAEVTLLEPVGEQTVAHAGDLRLVAWPAAGAKRVSTDAEGRFTLRIDRSAAWLVRAQASGFAAAVAGPFDVLAGTPEREVEIALVRGGAIEGSVRAADGHTIANALVAASRADGHARSQRTDGDGAFRFDALTPGGWQVRLVQSERDGVGAPHRQTTSLGVARTPIAWDCEVVDGGVTRFDLVRSEPVVVVLRWPLVLDAANAKAGSATLLGAFDSTDHTVALVPSTLEGGLVARLPRAGRCELGVEVQSAGHALRWTRRVELAPGKAVIDASFGFGTLRGRVLELRAGSQLVHTWTAGGDSIRVQVACSPDGRFVLPFAPAGSGTLALESIDRPRRERGVEVPAGGDVDIGEF